MSLTSNRIRSASVFAVAAIAVSLVAGSASAEMPILTSSTPSMIGGQVVGAGAKVLGASAGWPQLRGEFFFGMGRTFDLGVQPSLTYGGGWLGGYNQGVGTMVEVPLRFTLATLPKAAIALRVVPYGRIGREWGGAYYYGGGGRSFAFGTGASIGVRVSIPLPKLFSIVVGAETRAGFGGVRARNCDSSMYDCADGFFEGSTYAVIGLETLIKDKWFFFAEHDIGGAYVSGGGFGGGGSCYDPYTDTYYACGGGRGHAMYQFHAGFGYLIH